MFDFKLRTYNNLICNINYILYQYIKEINDFNYLLKKGPGIELIRVFYLLVFFLNILHYYKIYCKLWC